MNCEELSHVSRCVCDDDRQEAVVIDGFAVSPYHTNRKVVGRGTATTIFR